MSENKVENKVETKITLYEPFENGGHIVERYVYNPSRVKIHEHVLQIIYTDAKGILHDIKTTLPYLIESTQAATKDSNQVNKEQEVLLGAN